MIFSRRTLCLVMAFAFLVGNCLAQGGGPDPTTIPNIRSFIGEGFGAKHAKAPVELKQFGRLVGIWNVTAEVRGMDGKWQDSAPGVWVWKYALDGFAVRDLWYQGADNLPSYMAGLGRDYLLTANRLYDVANKKWQSAWMANGAGKVMGADFGLFSGNLDGDEIVLTSPPADGPFGLQRVVFYEFTDDSFKWKSDYSTDDGKTWNTVMRLSATRSVAGD